MSIQAAKAAGEDLADALRTVPDLRVAVGLGRPVTPPAAVVGFPRLSWAGFCTSDGPRVGHWVVYLISPLDEFAWSRLLELVGPVAAAVDEHTGGVVTSAAPILYPASGQGDLPCYEIQIEMELS